MPGLGGGGPRHPMGGGGGRMPGGPPGGIGGLGGPGGMEGGPPGEETNTLQQIMYQYLSVRLEL